MLNQQNMSNSFEDEKSQLKKELENLKNQNIV